MTKQRYKPRKEHSPLKAIREMCIECHGGRVTHDGVGPLEAIKTCASPDCALFEFRLGSNPYHKLDLSDEARKRRSERMKVFHAAKSGS